MKRERNIRKRIACVTVGEQNCLVHKSWDISFLKKSHNLKKHWLNIRGWKWPWVFWPSTWKKQDERDFQPAISMYSPKKSRMGRDFSDSKISYLRILPKPPHNSAQQNVRATTEHWHCMPPLPLSRWGCLLQLLCSHFNNAYEGTRWLLELKETYLGLM